jgi:hypothetical protein
MTPADIRACTCGNDGYGNGMFGGDGAWWIIILLLFGWGGRGYGFGGGFGGGNGGYPMCGVPATQADLAAGFNNSAVLNNLDGIENALCQGFNGVNTAILQSGYNTQSGINGLSHQLADCCCGIKGEIKDVAYGNERNAWTLSKQISDCCCDLEKMNMQNRSDAQAYNCNTLSAIDKVGDRIIDYLANEKTQALRDENFALRLQASQAKQNEFLISRLGDKCPEPAYIVQPPQQVTFPTNCCGNVAYAGYGSCGASVQ